MFFDEEQAMTACEEEPSLIFELIKEGHLELVDKLLRKKIVSVSEVDEEGNTVLMKLLKLKQYSLVSKYMTYSDFDPNHQNIEGNTFAHILAQKDYIKVAPIICKLKKNKEYGKYTRLSNLEVMLSNLEKKTNLLPRMEHLVQLILNDFEEIKNEIMKNKLTSMDHILRSVLVEGKA